MPGIIGNTIGETIADRVVAGAQQRRETLTRLGPTSVQRLEVRDAPKVGDDFTPAGTLSANFAGAMAASRGLRQASFLDTIRRRALGDPNAQFQDGLSSASGTPAPAPQLIPVVDRPTGVGTAPRKSTSGNIPPLKVASDNPRIRNINPGDIAAINSHAMFGDGTPREVDFTKVSLADLPGSVQNLASQSDSRLSVAIDKALATGKPQQIRLTEVNAGGGQGGKTGAQVGGIGRFSVTMDGVVTPSKGGVWTLNAKVIGEPDKQDYPIDTRRGNIAGPVNNLFGRVQQAAGGKDYWITFFGSQNVTVSGVKK